MSITRDTSDNEILAVLKVEASKSVTSEKNIWAFWDKGIDKMPGWCQRNVIGWARMLSGDGWTIRVLDNSNLTRFMEPEQMPKAWRDGNMTGPYVGAHTADILRLPLILNHGGLWIDVGVTLFRHVDDICWSAIMDTNNLYEVGGFADWYPGRHPPDFMETWFLAARKGNVWIAKWHEIHLEYWKNRTAMTDIMTDGLYQHLPPITFPDYLMKTMQLTDADIPAINDYLGHSAPFRRLRSLKEPNGGFNGAEYWEKHMLMIDGAKEAVWAHIQTGYVGQKLFEIFSTPIDDQDSEASKFSKHVLMNTSVLKNYRALKNMSPSLSTIWDQNPGSDDQSGTWWKYMRNESVKNLQTRSLMIETAPKVTKVWEAGLFETIDENTPFELKEDKFHNSA